MQAVHGPAAWRRQDFKEDGSWVHVLTAGQVAEIDACVKLHAQTPRIESITADQFHLPTLAPFLSSVQHELVEGRGFALLKGLPVHRYSTREAAIAYWGLCLHIGQPMPQNRHGHLIGHVRNTAKDPHSPDTRIYSTARAQPYHADRAADVIGLLCLKTAREGGHSAWCSSLSVFNEVLRRRPDLAQVLLEPFHIDRKGEIPAGQRPTYAMRLFSWQDGFLSVNFSTPYVDTASRHEGVAELTPLQKEALALVEELAGSDELRMDYDLEPGDIQLLHNHVILHSRTAFTDWEEPERRRHLLRAWLCPPIGRPLAPEWAQQYRSTEVGCRGGIWCPGVEPNVNLEREQ